MSHLRINYRPWETTKIGLFQENYQYSKEVAPTKKVGSPGNLSFTPCYPTKKILVPCRKGKYPRSDRELTVDPYGYL